MFLLLFVLTYLVGLCALDFLFSFFLSRSRQRSGAWGLKCVLEFELVCPPPSRRRGEVDRSLAIWRPMISRRTRAWSTELSQIRYRFVYAKSSRRLDEIDRSLAIWRSTLSRLPAAWGALRWGGAPRWKGETGKALTLSLYSQRFVGGGKPLSLYGFHPLSIGCCP